jgi:hypothetical protein
MESVNLSHKVKFKFNYGNLSCPILVESLALFVIVSRRILYPFHYRTKNS